MAQATSDITKIIRDYVAELERANIHPQKVILFGSYATGEAREWSDIDLSIITNDFEGKGILERQLILGRANQDLQAPLDLIGYTPEEVDQCESGTLLYEIVKHGQEIQS